MNILEVRAQGAPFAAELLCFFFFLTALYELGIKSMFFKYEL